jgi:hypothetical protein
MELLKSVISMNEEIMLQESIALFENVTKTLQPFIALLNDTIDGTKNPFTTQVSKPIPIDSFSAFLAGLKVLLDNKHRNLAGNDFETPEKSYEFFSNVAKPVKKYGTGSQTPQQVIIGVGKQAKSIWDDFGRRMEDWSNPKIRTTLVNEIKKLALDWDKQLNAFKTEMNKTQLSKAA